ncbi:META domain-containing protein [Foetidibacter luteolus]|uniref:META domain-containing protein n=1 Tax=Foetidibacter luteolus TaxID=2608880 RepID=UPI00129AFE30|nr:META domain-containing protein [Foetidibacter luteolus]
MKATLIMLLFAIVITSCNNQSGPAENADSAAVKAGLPIPGDTVQHKDTATLDGRWVLQPVLASDTAAGHNPEIIFDLSKSSFAGNTGCNRMSGTFVQKADSLKFNEQVITTRMACQGYNEKAFLDNLFIVNRYRIENGVLMFMNNETVVSKWVRNLKTPRLKEA